MNVHQHAAVVKTGSSGCLNRAYRYTIVSPLTFLLNISLRGIIAALYVIVVGVLTPEA